MVYDSRELPEKFIATAGFNNTVVMYEVIKQARGLPDRKLDSAMPYRD